MAKIVEIGIGINGEGIAKVANKILFVPFALKSKEVEVKITFIDGEAYLLNDSGEPITLENGYSPNDVKTTMAQAEEIAKEAIPAEISKEEIEYYSNQFDKAEDEDENTL